MRVLVTGGNGFIGRHTVADLVAQGHEVIVASRHGESAIKGAEAVQADLLADGAAAELIQNVKPEGLVHMAWETTHGAFWSAPENARWKIVTCDLLDHFLDHNGKRAVFAGSCAEYGWADLKPGELCSEATTFLSPNTYYGQQKLDAYWQVDEAIRQGASLAWGRVFFLYGIGETPTRFVPHVIRQLLAGESAEMSSGNQVRDFMDVRDVGRGFAALFAADSVTGAVNVASGQAQTLRQVAEEIARQIGRSELLKFGALPDREGEPETLVADVQRLMHEVSFQPKYSLEDGLADMIASLR